MATLTITEKSRQAIGNRLQIVSHVVLGANAVGAITVTAASLGLNYIDSCQMSPGTFTSAVAADWHLSDSSGLYINILIATATAADAFELLTIGY